MQSWAGRETDLERSRFFYRSGHASRIGFIKMSHTDGEGIRGIGRWRFAELQEGSDHECDLLLVGRSPTDHRLFHPARRIFENFETVLCGSDYGSATRGSHRDCRLEALDENDALDGANFGAVFLDDLVERLADRNETGGLPQASLVADDPVGQGTIHRLAPRFEDLLKDCIPRIPQGWIDGKNTHERIYTGFETRHVAFGTRRAGLQSA